MNVLFSKYKQTENYFPWPGGRLTPAGQADIIGISSEKEKRNPL